MKLIDKAALVAEIEKLKGQLLKGACSSQISMQTHCKEEAYDEVLSFLDTLDVLTLDDIKEMENQAFIHGIEVERNENIDKEIRL